MSDSVLVAFDDNPNYETASLKLDANAYNPRVLRWISENNSVFVEKFESDLEKKCQKDCKNSTRLEACS